MVKRVIFLCHYLRNVNTDDISVEKHFLFNFVNMEPTKVAIAFSHLNTCFIYCPRL